MDLLDSNLTWNITDGTTAKCDTNNIPNTSLPLSSPLSHSSAYSMDSGYSGYGQAGTSPSHIVQQMTPPNVSGVPNNRNNMNNCMNDLLDLNAESLNVVNNCMPDFYDQTTPVSITFPYLSPTPSSASTNTFRDVNVESIPKPQLEIVEQPAYKPFRFRYVSEMHGTHGSLMGIRTERSRRTFPTVALRNFNFASRAIIRCTLYQVSDGSASERYPHSHKLVIKRGAIEECDPHEIEVSNQNDFTAIFQGMGIIHTTKKNIKEELFKKMKREKEFEENRPLNTVEVSMLAEKATKQSKAMNLNQVCLCFKAFIKNDNDNTWVQICDPIYSQTVNNMKAAVTGELRICRMSTYISPASGGQEVFMFVEKVCRNNIKVKFYDVKDDGSPGSWEEYGIFNETDVHHQFGIVLKTPPYKDQSIVSNVDVMVQLIRPSDGSSSEPLQFRYKPNIHTGPKRKRSDSIDFIPTVVGSHESSQVNTVSSFGENIQNNDSQNSFSGNFYQNNSNQPQAMEQTLFESEPSFFGTFLASDLSLTPNDLKGFSQISPEEFCRLLEIDTGDEPKLQLDGAGGTFIEKSHPETLEINCSLLDKLKLLIKLFKNNYDDEKLKEMMMVLIDAHTEMGQNILLDCIEHGSLEENKDLVLILIKYKLLNDLLHTTNDLDQNCLHLAILSHQRIIMKILLNLGAKVNQIDAFGQSPLHLAVEQGFEECVKDLLDVTSIDLDVLNDDGFTPLHLAIKNNNLFIIQALIRAGSNVQKKCPTSGNNALHLAVEIEDFNIDVVKSLIQADENLLHQENNSRMNVLQLASDKNHPESLLQYLASFYEETYTKIASIDNDDDDSESDNEATDEKLFDDKCLMELSAIFDDNEKWRYLMILLEIEDHSDEWEVLPSPSRGLFNYLEQSKKSLDSIVDIFTVLDEHRAINVIDEMVVRKLNN